MLQLVIGVGDKVGHVGKASALIVIPLETNATIERPCVVYSVFVVWFDTVYEVLFVFL